jgi:hypothetical protein
MSTKSKVKPVNNLNELDEKIKAAEKKRKNSNSSFSSPRTENSNKPPKPRRNSKQNNGKDYPESFHSITGGGSNHASPREHTNTPPAPLTRARSLSGDTSSRSRSNSLTSSLRRNSSIRRNSSFRGKKKHVTFRNPLTDYEPDWSHLLDEDATPATTNEYAEYSFVTTMRLDEDLKQRQELRKKRQKERLEKAHVGKKHEAVEDEKKSLVVTCLSLLSSRDEDNPSSCTIS